MKYPLLNLAPVFLFSVLISCNGHDGAAPKADSLIIDPNKSLAGQMYFFAPGYDSTHFVATSNCDCCSANALFLDDSVCLYIDYCDEGCSYVRGIYHLQNGQLEMNFDSLVLEETYPETKDSSGLKPPEISYDFSSERSKKLKFKKQEYKGRTVFTASNEFGTVDTTISTTEKMKEVQAKGVWDRLTGKTKVVNQRSPAAAMPDLLGSWAGTGDGKTSFQIQENYIFYPENFKQYKYSLEHDSLKIKFDDYEGVFAIKMNGRDTLILTGDERQVFHRFKKSGQ